VNQPWRLAILLVERAEEAREATIELLEGAGHRVHAVADGMQALAAARTQGFDLVISDVDGPLIDGFSLLEQLRRSDPTIHCILAASDPSIEQAVSATKAGAEYLRKPLAAADLLAPLGAIARRFEARAALCAEGSDECKLNPLIGRSKAMFDLRRNLEVIAECDGSVLVCGESGTGKELVARMIHALGPRRNGPLVAVNCAAFPDTLLDAELFGHERGAFTGATGRREGRFEAADGGTLFLDEIGEMPLPAQAKLLRVLENGSFQRLGSSKTTEVDVRVVSATNRDLEHMVEQGTLREDLYYRLKVFKVDVPPLRERPSDIPLLVEYFCHKHVRRGEPIPSVSPGVWAVLAARGFRGNVRELEHGIRHALAFARGGEELRVEHLPADWRAVADDQDGGSRSGRRSGEVVPLSSAVTAFEYEYLRQTLQHTDGNRSRAANLLGISRKSLWAKLKRYRRATSSAASASVSAP
jgi:DNA-binding NtrC family response regulator